jgi:hypothetical protein
VTRKYQVEGEYVEEGARLYDVADLSTVWIEAQVYEEDTVGSYLLDAETRVSASAGSIYYGGTGSGGKAGVSAAAVRPSTPEDEAVKAQAALAKLSTPDRQLAEAQKYCVVLGSRLGSMGTPVKVVLQGQPVFLCCKGCIEEAREHPERALAKLKKGAPQPPAGKREGPAVNSAPEVKIRDSLAALGAEDRRLAEAQGLCPVNETRLGVMGKPVKVVLKSQPVFLCCDSCIDEAKAEPDKTLAKVKEQKEKGATRP